MAKDRRWIAATRTATLFAMPTYRDVDAGLRIETLEAKLAERDAALAARDAELNELRADLAGELGGMLRRARRRTRIAVVVGGLVSAVLGLAYLTGRAEVAREQAHLHDSVEMARSHQQQMERQIAEAKEKLDACLDRIDPAQPPPPRATFGAPSDRAAIEAALEAAARTAEKCSIVPGSKGIWRVQMVFDSMRGSVESASLEYGPLTDSGVIACLLEPFRHVHVGAFKGARVTLTKEIHLQ